MLSIGMLGSEEQKERWLPSMARMDRLGAFALTEPDHGSDVVGLGTRARRDGEGWVLDGAKRWIGNGSVADVVVVWARDDDGHVGGFVVETEDARLRRRGHHREGLQPRGVAGGDHTAGRPRPGRQPPAQAARSRTPGAC